MTRQGGNIRSQLRLRTWHTCHCFRRLEQTTAQNVAANFSEAMVHVQFVQFPMLLAFCKNSDIQHGFCSINETAKNTPTTTGSQSPQIQNTVFSTLLDESIVRSSCILLPLCVSTSNPSPGGSAGSGSCRTTESGGASRVVLETGLSSEAARLQQRCLRSLTPARRPTV